MQSSAFFVVGVPPTRVLTLADYGTRRNKSSSKSKNSSRNCRRLTRLKPETLIAYPGAHDNIREPVTARTVRRKTTLENSLSSFCFPNGTCCWSISTKLAHVHFAGYVPVEEDNDGGGSDYGERCVSFTIKDPTADETADAYLWCTALYVMELVSTQIVLTSLLDLEHSLNSPSTSAEGKVRCVRSPHIQTYALQSGADHQITKLISQINAKQTEYVTWRLPYAYVVVSARPMTRLNEAILKFFRGKHDSKPMVFTV